jgi:hypothetical protein
MIWFRDKRMPFNLNHKGTKTQIKSKVILCVLVPLWFFPSLSPVRKKRHSRLIHPCEFDSGIVGFEYLFG